SGRGYVLRPRRPPRDPALARRLPSPARHHLRGARRARGGRGALRGDRAGARMEGGGGARRPARRPRGMIAFRTVRRLSAILRGLFPRRTEVVGRERLPASGPAIVAANHHNGLVDGMLLLATAPRPLSALAKAPLFRNPLLGPFLWALGAIPVE